MPNYSSLTSKTSVKHGLDKYMKTMTFYFNGTYYNEVKGTAMSTNCASTYATLVHGFLVEKLYDTIEVNFRRKYSVYFNKDGADFR